MTTNDWRATVTGETVTDRQIREFSEAAAEAGDLEAVEVCGLALDGDVIAREDVARWYQSAWAAEDHDDA